MRGQIEVAASAACAFKPAPIPAAHVLSGNPTATNSVMFQSADRLQMTLMWHCTCGSFRWFYDEDETLMVLEGGMTLHFDDGSLRACGPGDVVFFHAGSTCVWVIETEVRKIAFFRQPAPTLVALPLRLARKLAERFGLRPRHQGAKSLAPPQTPHRVRSLA